MHFIDPLIIIILEIFARIFLFREFLGGDVAIESNRVVCYDVLITKRDLYRNKQKPTLFVLLHIVQNVFIASFTVEQ